MIAANQELFGKLANACSGLVSAEILAQKRCIKTDPNEKKWLKNTRFIEDSLLSVGPGINLYFATYEDETYFISLGLEIASLPAEFTAVKLNSGLFTALVVELDVELRNAAELPLALQEYVFYPVPVGEVEYLDMETIKMAFPPITVYKIDKASALLNEMPSIFRSALSALLSSNQGIPLAWSEQSREILRRCIYDRSTRAPFHLIFRSLTEARADNAFISIYRCVEQLFPIPKIVELSTALSIPLPAMEVAVLIEKHLGWRKREDEALLFLISSLPDELVSRISSALGLVTSADVSSGVSRRIYELRNQCVHYRPIHGSTVPICQSQWLALAELLLESVEALYLKHASAFPQFRSSEDL